jgi:hypothetical protein
MVKLSLRNVTFFLATVRTKSGVIEQISTLFTAYNAHQAWAMNE